MKREEFLRIVRKQIRFVFDRDEIANELKQHLADSIEDLMEEAGNGIYVTSVEGMHAGANEITGDFSLSSGGFKIENGKKSTPIKGFTISGNFLQLMKDISTVGEDLKFRPSAFGSFRCGSPSILVKGIKVAGK